MNIAHYAIKHRVISWMFLIILAIGGVQAFGKLGRLEDPAFTIKDAMVIVQYPGASAMEVEEELTYPLEKAIRQLPYVDKITSTSTQGMSQIKVSMKMEYDGEELPQIWDELRRKITDEQPKLPLGALPPLVMDDFGDVFGIMLLITGDNYSYSELKEHVDYLRRELELIEGVGKVSLAGEQQEQIHIEISLKKLAALNLDISTVIGLLNQQNTVLNAGRITINGESLHLRPGGFDSSVDPIIHGRDTGKLVRLTDVATISRGYQEIPTNLVQHNGQRAISLGVSFATGVNVVEVGKKIDARLAELDQAKPAGIKLHTLYDQPKEVENSVNSFLISLAEAVAIVIVVLLFAMGVRSGLIIGVVLLLTVFGTFILMQWNNVELHRISLGALIIALGMLVDNAIVIVEGILVGRQRGLSKIEAAGAIAKQTIWPLLGATVIAITAFAPIGLSPDATGEFMGSLFWVLCYSLFLSWITALTLTPFLADLLLPEKDTQQADAEPYKGAIFTIFSAILRFALRQRALTVIAMVGLLFGAVAGLTQVKNTFFPPSNTPIFYLDMWLPEGTELRETHRVVQQIEQEVLAREGVKFVTSSTGQGMQRFTLTYTPEQQYPAFAQLQVRTETREGMLALMKDLVVELPRQFPQVQFQPRLMDIGPSPKSKIEARISGPDPDTLRDLAGQVEAIFSADPDTRNIRHNWRERTKVLEPKINEPQARRLGISNEEIANTLKMAFGGTQVGQYRDGTRTLPIVVRLPEQERGDYASFDNLILWSPTLQTYVPIEQVISNVELNWQDSVIQRKDRKRTLTVMADHDILGDGTAFSLFMRLKPQVEAIPLPAGYSLEWGGEYEAQTDAQKMLFSSLPMGFLLMFVITVFLFDSLRKPLVIWLTVPLSVIGVTVGLLGTNLPFTFTALLGLLSLSGMVLKNGIVLMDQLNLELDSGKAPYPAIMDATISRVRPVCMAALTTILGMIPLVFDAFFASMAVTIMFGLGFATILTLVVVPVLYATLYRIRPPKTA